MPATPTVTLTATITHGAVSTTKEFQVTVLEDGLDDAGKVQEALAAIELVHPDDVRGNLTLPTKGSSGTAITLGVVQARRRDVHR